MKNIKNIKICAVVIGKNLDQFLYNLENVQKIVDFVELRVDTIKNLKLDDIVLIRKKTKKTSIFTCRIKNEGGEFVSDEKEHLKIIKKAFDLNFDFFDIEYSSFIDKKIIIPEDKKNKIIVSYHNFLKTPSLKELQKLVFLMKNYGKIIKIATFVKNSFDNLKLFNLMINKKKDEKRIIIGMGKKGKITRIFGPFLGNYFTYGSTKFGASAPGQIDIISLKKIYEYIGQII